MKILKKISKLIDKLAYVIVEEEKFEKGTVIEIINRKRRKKRKKEIKSLAQIIAGIIKLFLILIVYGVIQSALIFILKLFF